MKTKTFSDPNMRVPTPTHLFDVVPPSNPNHMKKNDTLCDDDFKEVCVLMVQKMYEIAQAPAPLALIGCK